MKNEKISIIVPAYNSEKNIECCIKSIEKQTYKNLEIIIINDGSKDNTRSICEKMQKQYNNIILINQENAGVSASRNVGIDKATGKYIMFVDSDDFIEANTLEVMLRYNEEEADLTIANYKKYYSENNIINNVSVEEKKYNKKEFLDYFWDLYYANLINSPCFRIYKKDIIKKNNINFNLNYELGEDLIFNLQYLDKCENIYILKEYLYNYRYSINSLTTKYRENYLEIQMKLSEYIKEFLINNNAYNSKNEKQMNKNICNIIISSIQSLFLPSSGLSRKEKRRIIKRYLNLKEIELFDIVEYESNRLKFIKKIIVAKKTNTIIIYSEIKELLKKIIKKQ